MVEKIYRAKSNGKWVYGYLYHEEKKWGDEMYILIYNKEIEKEEYVKIDQQNSCISVCTMLKDITGKLIFEGDLLREDVTTDMGDTITDFFPVVFNSSTGCWCIDNSYYKNRRHLVPIVDYFGEQLIVDGNIYENSNRLPKLIFEYDCTPRSEKNDKEENYK